MTILCVIGCGKKKIWDDNPSAGPTRAEDAYTGPLTKKYQEFAKRFFPNNWVILSAKYGFVFPNDLIHGPYDVRFGRKNPEVISIDELRKQLYEKELNKYDTIVVMAGKDYADVIKKVFQEAKIITPLEGMRLGKTMKMIKDRPYEIMNRIKNIENIDSHFI